MTTDIDWNPSWPEQVGLEARYPNYMHWSVDSFTKPLVLSFVPTTTTTVTNMRVFNNGTSTVTTGTIYNNVGRPMVCEIFQDGGENDPVFAFSDYRVASAGVTGGGMWNENLTAASGNRLQTKNDGLYIVAQANNYGMYVRFGDSINLFDTNRTVIKVGLGLRLNATTRVQRVDAGVGTALWENTIPWYQPSGFSDVIIYNGEVKVDYGASEWSFWQPNDIRNFAAIGAPGVPKSWFVRCVVGGGGAWKLDYCAMRVYYTTNPRVGMGVAALTAGSGTWADFKLTQPNGTSGITLTAGQRYTVMVRQIYDYTNPISGTMSPRGMGSAVGEHAEWEVRSINRYGYSDATTGPAQAGLPTIIFMNGSSTVPMAQPYNLARPVQVMDSSVYLTDQMLTISGSAASEVYGQVIASVGIKGTLPRDTRLRCEVYSITTGNRVLGPAEMTARSILRFPVDAGGTSADTGMQMRRVRFLFDTPATLPAGQYRVRFTCPDNLPYTATNFFVIPAYHYIEDPKKTPDRSFSTPGTASGNTDYAHGFVPISGVLTNTSGSTFSSDLLITLATVPAAVTGISATHGVLTTHNAKVCPQCNSGGKEECSSCSDATMPFATITWDTLAGTLLRYEVERQDDLSPNWEPVAHVDPAETTWPDYEASIGVQSRYRVRGVNTDGIPGQWSDTTTVVVGEYGGNPGRALCFSSNAAVNMSVVYPEIWNSDTVSRDFTFQETDDVAFTSIYGRERQVAFWPAERKGIQFERSILLNAVCTVAIPTMDIFRPIRDLAWAPIPYVCVRDGEGNRWYANIQVTEGLNKRPGEMWYASVTITEVSDRPAIHDTSVEQVEALL